MKRNLKRVSVLISFFALFLLWVPSAYAVENVDNLSALQEKVDDAMHSRTTFYSINYTGNAITLTGDLKNIISAIYSADDYMQYVTKSYKYSYLVSNGVATITFNFSYWETAEQSLFVSDKITQILTQIIIPGMNDYQKEKAIHDWIVKNIAYDTSLAQHSAYAGMVPPYKTVCQGYALLGYKMLNQAGIETRIIEGNARNQLHAWNLVKLDGVWYHLDLTWDDPVPDVANRAVYNYYNLTDAQIKADHTWTKSYPTATTMFNEKLEQKKTDDPSNSEIYDAISNDVGLQYLEAEYTANNQTELGAKIQQAIQTLKPGLIVRYMSGATVATDLQNVVKNITNITSYSYRKTDYIRTTATGDVLLDLIFTYNVPVPVTGVTLSGSNLNLTVGGVSGTLTATLSPTNASNKNILWTTSDPNVATVIGGVVKAVGGGSATITATTVDGNKTATSTVNVTAAVKSISLTKTTLALKVGQPDETLSPVFTPTSATNKNVTWSSSNTNVATVDSSGKVHAVAPGTAAITVTTEDGKKIARCTVTVPVVVTGVSLKQASLTLNVGKQTTMIPVFTPTNATIKTAAWSSSNPEIATVSTTGAVKAISPGTTVIKATTTDGEFEATCQITVVRLVASVSLNKTTLILKVGDEDVTLTAAVNPSNASNTNITWTSSNGNVATVDSGGKVHAVAPGTAVIAVTTEDGKKTAKCTVTVPIVATGVSLKQSAVTLGIGAQTVLTPVFTPANATIRTVTWSSDNSAVATVSATGAVKGIAPGDAVIKITTADGGFEATCQVKVVRLVSSVALSKPSLTQKVGEEDVTLAATVNPSNASNMNIAWTSSNNNVATVNNSGKVHAVAPGTAVITVTTEEGKKIARCTVTVPVVATGISLNQTNLRVGIGAQSILTPVFVPANTTIKSVTWSSDNTAIATISATGAVKGVAEGTTTIKIKTIDGGFEATCEVNVVRLVTSVALNKTTLSLKVGDEAVTLAATVNPASATNKNVTWISSNIKVVTVDSNGQVHAVAPGTATITVTTVDGKKTARCTVKVSAA